MKSQVLPIYGGSLTTGLVLVPSALIAIAIALTILFAPDVFYSGYGIEVVGNATLANELKAPAGTLLIAGLLMFAGVFRRDLAVFSLATATVVYLSYGLSRVISIVLDGVPHSGMISAAGIELLVGAICLATLLQTRRANAG
ncbi:MAG: DUF4345 domain-containing protein [Woeseiaceae bacterium]|nr:DUF4345 domain-containing protein [Woeseiaceae bacterium]